ncbi:50S ribosomal protein L6 [uncultured archaeon]|nr:50S ribosomal protein L6 [uncultured archaeon]
MAEEKIEFPSGVSISLARNEFTISGPKGKVTAAIPPVTAKVEGNAVTISGSDKSFVNTAVALVKSATKGVTEGYTMKLQIVYAHFPITLEQKGAAIVIKNFLGEKNPRKAKVVGDTKVKVEKEFISLSGTDKYAIGQTATNLKQATHIRFKDPRVFQDGIYDAPQ